MAIGQEPDNINKEFLRLWMANQGYRGEGEMPPIPQEVIVETALKYIQAFEMITGEAFKAEPGVVLTRIENNLKPYAL